MRLIANRELLLASFGAAAKVANPRSTKEVHTTVKLIADMTGVTLFATDMEVSMMAKASGCDVQFPGEVLLPVSRMGLILRECTDDTLTIEDVGTEIHVTTASSNFKLPSMDPKEYPMKGTEITGPHHKMSAKYLLTAIRRTAFATDEDSSRYALGGILFELNGKESNIVGTDGRRLAAVYGEVEAVDGHKTNGMQSILPSKAARILSQTVKDSGDVKICFSLNDVTVEAEGVSINSRLVEGRYPNWRQVIPSRDDWAYDFEVPAGVLDSTIRQAAITADVETRGLEFEIVPGTLYASGNAAGTGKSKISMPIAHSGDESMKTKLDFRYLRDFLAVHDPASAVRLRLMSQTESVLMSCEGYNYVVMPMALDR